MKKKGEKKKFNKKERKSQIKNENEERKGSKEKI